MSKNHKKSPPPVCSIVPPHLIQKMLESTDPKVRAAAAGSIVEGPAFQGRRELLQEMRAQELQAGEAEEEEEPSATMPVSLKFTYDCRQQTRLPGQLAWRSGQEMTGRPEIDEASEGAQLTDQILREVFGRSGIDGRGGRIIFSSCYGRKYNNAYWQGSQIVSGLGDGYVFNRFTIALDIPAHEMAHGITQHTCGLEYYSQAGALNEHFSDVFGAIVRQYKAKQKAEEADWIIGAGLLTANIRGTGLRNMLRPGTAYNDPQKIGKDPQPDHMEKYYSGDADSQGVHINSGIPNRAFALAAVEIGGPIWEGIAQVWYDAHVRGGVRPWCNFGTYAQITINSAKKIWGQNSVGRKAVEQGWRTVGVIR